MHNPLKNLKPIFEHKVALFYSSREYERGLGAAILNGFSGIVCYIFESFQVTRDVVQPTTGHVVA